MPSQTSTRLHTIRYNKWSTVRFCFIKEISVWLSSILFLAASIAFRASASSLDITFTFSSFILTVTEDCAPLTALMGFKGVEITNPGAPASAQHNHSSFHRNWEWNIMKLWHYRGPEILMLKEENNMIVSVKTSSLFEYIIRPPFIGPKLSCNYSNSKHNCDKSTKVQRQVKPSFLKITHPMIPTFALVYISCTLCKSF